MSEGDRAALALASFLLEYPDDAWLEELEETAARLAPLLAPEDAACLADFRAALRSVGISAAREEYVRVFDHDSETSPYLAWHRYGDDRGQGQALAALNGLYRAAGFEPFQGAMPDYLPRMLEFLSACEDWAAEALLDGFGAELAKIEAGLEARASLFAPALRMGLAPLKKAHPAFFEPRGRHDPTLRPMARRKQEIWPGEIQPE